MTWNWIRLGDRLQAARKAKKLTQGELAELAGVSLATVQAIEGGKTFQRVTPTVRGLARLVGWTDDSPEAVLNGGDPTLADTPDRPAAPPRNEVGQAGGGSLGHLPARIRAELEEGQVLDTGVYDLSPGDDSGAQLIVVIKAPSTATPAQIRQYMDEVRRAERKLRRIADDQDE
ncbi:helix-turn-helix domain-containing protein [Streptomyces sp. NPDC006207]